MPSSTVEDYLKRLYQLRPHADRGMVSMGELAQGMSVAPGTATAMVKTLHDAGLVRHEPRTGVRLTLRGRKLALAVLRRHRLVELFLVRVLGVDWSNVHDDAERLEHAISDELLERIDLFLGRPSVDPHGDPIPTADGQVHSPRRTTLADCTPGQRVRLTRVLDQEPEFLRFVNRHGLLPGATVKVEKRESHSDCVTVKPERRRRVTVGSSAAGKLLVE